MKFLTTALYLGLAAIANAEPAEWSGLAVGEMSRLEIHETPRPIPDAVFYDAAGTERDLKDYAGKYVLVNFWALWCGPCREEMPALDTLQQRLGGDAFEVVTLAVWRNPLPGIEDFFEEHGIDDLEILLDPERDVSGAMGVDMLPISVIVDPEGREIARMTGDADWAGADAMRLLGAIVAGDG